MASQRFKCPACSKITEVDECPNCGSDDFKNNSGIFTNPSVVTCRNCGDAWGKLTCDYCGATMIVSKAYVG